MKSKTASPNHGGYDESHSHYISCGDDFSAADMLVDLRKSKAIEKYIIANNVPADHKAMPLLVSSINEEGIFYFSLPSTVTNQHYFSVRIVGDI